MKTMERIRAIICAYVDVDAALVREETSLRNDIGATSFDLMNIAVAIEEAFSVSVPDRRMLAVKTVGDLATLLER